jgi:riboflavin kinase, archaea type
MQDIKSEYIITLAKLLLKGAKDNFIEFTSTDIGIEINKSQQAASKIILELQEMKYVERIKKGHGYMIRVTEEGLSSVKKMSEFLNMALNSSPGNIHFNGILVSGMGEGKYYMSLEGYRKQFKKKIGYIPYPGTLNIRIFDPLSLENREKIERFGYQFIDGFRDSERTYGWVKCYSAIMNDNVDIQSDLLILERTHHDKNMLEIIAPVNIKQLMGLKNGDNVKVTLQASKNTTESYIIN